jgi:hypothetical protein
MATVGLAPKPTNHNAAESRRSTTMTRETLPAWELLNRHGSALVGVALDTLPMGEWTGGRARITEVRPDPNAPEIAFNVKRLSDGAEIGVFREELVTVEVV